MLHAKSYLKDGISFKKMDKIALATNNQSADQTPCLLISRQTHVNTLKYYNSCIDGHIAMQTVTVSPKYQIVIPKKIRDQLHIKPGQKMVAMPYGEHIQLVPVKAAKELRGILEGCAIDMDNIRDKSDRF